MRLAPSPNKLARIGEIEITLHTLARQLGGEVVGDHIAMPGPGHSKRDRSLSVWIDHQGVRVYSHAGDHWRTARDFVMTKLGMRRCPSVVARPAASGDIQQSSVNSRAAAIWSAAQSIQGTIAELYLNSRGLAAPLGDEVLRFHSSCPFGCRGGPTIHLPAMVALFRDLITNAPLGIHRTALMPKGIGKADHPGLGGAKKMLGPNKNAAIKLSADPEVTVGIGIAEGIESALSVYGAHWRPIWALGSAGAIARFPILAGVESLSIFADADPAGIKCPRIPSNTPLVEPFHESQEQAAPDQ
jgi:putative DNA primase/helicase